MFRDDVNMDSRTEVLAYRDEMLAIADHPKTAQPEVWREMAQGLQIIADGLPDDDPEKSPVEAPRA